MCGRYNFTVDESDEIQEILEKLNAKFQSQKYKTGEIFPTDCVPVLLAEKQEIAPALINWGFPRFDSNGVIINARSETAFEKKTFRDSLVNRRCIIPSTGFYEWDSYKRKYLFRLEDSNTLYMAGLYMHYQDGMRYVILTTAANASIQDVHDRMPLIISKNDIATWIMDQHATIDILKMTPPQLKRQAV